MKPMLAALVKRDDLPHLDYPLLVQPKYDGIRCLITEDGPVSRKLKPIPNTYISSLLSATHMGGHARLFGCDGEIIAGPTYRDTASAVMSQEGAPKFTYYVFDRWVDDSSYMVRASRAYDQCRGLPYVQPSPATIVTSADAVLKAFADMEWLLGGHYDGIILRDPDSPYKFGRSTKKQQYLLKYKEFEDAEARVVAFRELMHNENALERDALGYAKRSHAQEGKVAGGKLGALLCRSMEGVMFSIGTGFTDEQRISIWKDRDYYKNALVTYRFQGGGGYEAPRFPSFVAFRRD